MRSPSAGSVEDSSSARFQPSRRSNPPDGIPPVEGLRMRQVFTHEPVMVDEVVALFAPVPPGVVIDATAGGGGHAAALLEAHAHLRLLCLDRDPDAVEATSQRLATFGDRAQVRRARFDRLGDVAAEMGIGPGSASGVLFDLGVSSPQLDRPERGFSYRADGPLDMRMDPDEGTTAADLVNTWPEAELARLFAANGEGRFARRIAWAVVAARPVTTTAALADVVRSAMPAAARRQGGHPARRVLPGPARGGERGARGPGRRRFPVAIDTLAPGAAASLIAYHSGEDRIVKAAFRQAETGGCTCPPGLPVQLWRGVVGQARVPRDSATHCRRDDPQPALPRARCSGPSSGARPDGRGDVSRARHLAPAPARLPDLDRQPRRGIEAPGQRGPRWSLPRTAAVGRGHRPRQPDDGGGGQRVDDPGSGPPDPDAVAADRSARATPRPRAARGEALRSFRRGVPGPAPWSGGADQCDRPQSGERLDLGVDGLDHARPGTHRSRRPAARDPNSEGPGTRRAPTPPGPAGGGGAVGSTAVCDRSGSRASSVGDTRSAGRARQGPGVPPPPPRRPARRVPLLAKGSTTAPNAVRPGASRASVLLTQAVLLPRPGGPWPARAATSGAWRPATPRRARKSSPVTGGVQRRRIGVMRVVVVLVFAALAVRLIGVQVFSSGRYSAMGAAEVHTTVHVPAVRGGIYDRNGAALALSVARSNIVADPFLIHDPAPVARALTSVLGVSTETLTAELSEHSGYVVPRQRGRRHGGQEGDRAHAPRHQRAPGHRAVGSGRDTGGPARRHGGCRRLGAVGARVQVQLVVGRPQRLSVRGRLTRRRPAPGQDVAARGHGSGDRRRAQRRRALAVRDRAVPRCGDLGVARQERDRHRHEHPHRRDPLHGQPGVEDRAAPDAGPWRRLRRRPRPHRVRPAASTHHHDGAAAAPTRHHGDPGHRRTWP